jgi:predicted protein tyrosine phosphatase
VAWNTAAFSGDEERVRYHERKMSSKDLRPQAHLSLLDLGGRGTVMHIDHFSRDIDPEVHRLKVEIINRRRHRLSEYQKLDLQKRAQMVAPGVYLGPLSVACNEDDLANLGITAIMSVLGEDQHSELAKIPNSSSQLERHWVQVSDRVEVEEQMTRELPAATELLNKWISNNRVVLIHCQSGISRSATITISYIMRYLDKPLIEAYGLVHQARSVINPNDGFFRSLQHFNQSHCGAAYDDDGVQLKAELDEYNAFQLVSQLAFTGVSLDQARIALRACGGDITAAAGRILRNFENS